MSGFKKYRITYFLEPDADNIEFTILAKSYDEAVQFARDYRRDSFNVEEVERKEYSEPGR